MPCSRRLSFCRSKSDGRPCLGIGNDHVVNWNWIRSLGPKRTTVAWRIQEIPHARSEAKGVASMLPAIGALVFIAGFALTILNGGQGAGWAFASLILMFGGLWWHARKRRESWVVVPARCVDRELKQVMSAGGMHKGWVWQWRVVCDYRLEGREYRVTPLVCWTTFRTEAAALKFLAKRISPSGECKLGVNPQSPLEAELLGKGLREFLFWLGRTPKRG